MTDFDWLIIVGYCTAVLCVGWHHARRNKTLDDFLLGGRRCRSFPVATSLFVSWFSVISYLTWPGEIIANGPLIFVGLVAAPLVLGFVGWVVVPRVRSLGTITQLSSGLCAIEYQESPTSVYQHLDCIHSRHLASALFLAMRLAWMGMIAYLTATIIIEPLCGWSPWFTASALVGVTAAYSLGGYRAVVWTDCIQAVLMFGGAVLIVVLVGCWSGEWLPTEWPSQWPAASWSCSPWERVTVPWAILSTISLGLCVKCGDQMNVQRYLSTPTTGGAQVVLIGSVLLDLALTALLVLVGLSLMTYYAGGEHDADAFLLQFIADWFPAGLRGLVVAALLAAAMSSLSSGINACVSTVAVDWGAAENRGSKLQPVPATVIIALVVLLLSLGIGLVQGNLLELCYKIVNLLATPLGGLVLTALFIPRATKWGAWAGCAASVAIVVWVNYFSPLSFLCASPLALTTQLTIGWAART